MPGVDNSHYIDPNYIRFKTSNKCLNVCERVDMEDRNKDDPLHPQLFCISSMSGKKTLIERKEKYNYYEIVASIVIYAATWATFKPKPKKKKSALKTVLIFSQESFSYVLGKWNSYISGNGTFKFKLEK